MAINLQSLDRVVHTLVGLGARQVILFGSAVTDPQHARDIDLAVDGIPLSKILEADSAIGDILEQPYDLIAKEQNHRFYEIISRYGKILYG